MSNEAYVVSAEAREDVFEIGGYIADDSLEAALRVMDKLHDAFKLLGQNPGAGHFREELDSDEYRFWHVYDYVIVYKWKTSPIEILAVVHGARRLGVVLARRNIG